MKKPSKKTARKAAPARKAKTPAAKAPRLPIEEAVIRKLAEVMKDTGLSEISWSDGKMQVKLASGGGGGTWVAAPAASAAPAAAPAAAPVAAAPSGNDPASHPGAVKSPMVGTAYVAAEPGAAAFVREGDTVKQGQTVLIVEAMKTMNPIPAPKGGRVVKIMIEDKQPVEFGQVLMIIE